MQSIVRGLLPISTDQHHSNPIDSYFAVLLTLQTGHYGLKTVT